MATISVIIPAFNHAAFIRQCVDSVLEQTYQDIEIVVVDDGSTDGTVEILRQYGDRIVLIEQTNQGTQAARNQGISRATGEFVALLDSDDYWLPHKLERQMPLFAQEPGVALVYSLAYIANQVNGYMIHQNALAGEAIDEAISPWATLLVANRIPALTAVFRRSCADAIGPFDESLFGAADWDFWLRIAARWAIRCVPEPLACYRVHGLNTTKDLYGSRMIFSEHERVLNKTRASFPDLLSDEAVWSQALARLHVVGAEVEALAGNIPAASTEVALAIELDPNLPYHFIELPKMMADWVLRSCDNNRTSKACRDAVDEIFSRITSPSPMIRSLKREVLSIAAMKTTFTSYQEHDLAVVRSMLPIGVAAKPRWLLNLGVWSIGARAAWSWFFRSH